jgi:hypothetical protein
MILIDTFDSDEEAEFLINVLKKNSIQNSEKKGSAYENYINEADESKLNEIIKTLD